jgi:hypothetical protein
MIRLITAALIVAAATPAIACDWNKSADAASSQSTVASQSGAQHSKPVQHNRS